VVKQDVFKYKINTMLITLMKIKMKNNQKKKIKKVINKHKMQIPLFKNLLKISQFKIKYRVLKYRLKTRKRLNKN